MAKRTNIPTHSLITNSVPCAVEDIAHKNAYNYSKKHRHSYFEIILIKEGGGKQWIDFQEISLKDNSCYIILPKQVHLLKRDPETSGRVIQFSEDLVVHANLLGMLNGLDNPILFEEDARQFDSIFLFSRSAITILERNNSFQASAIEGFLQMMAFHLLGETTRSSISRESLHHQFTQLVEEHYHQWHHISNYIEALGVSESKLGKITRKHLGSTPLQVVHNRILLEAKRLIFFEDQSIKEISYQLGFNYPSNFAHFIKKKTGHTPTEMQKQAKRMNS